MKLFQLKKENTTTTTMVTVVLILLIVGAVFSLIFSRQISSFFYHVKTDPVASLIHTHADDFFTTEKYFIFWQDEEAQKALKGISADLKIHIPQVAAVNIYNKEGVLIWSDLLVYQEKVGLIHEEEDIKEVFEKGQLIKPAGESIARQIGSPHLLEVYALVEGGMKNSPIGVIEVYLDISDLVSFVQYLYVYIWGTILGSLIIIFLLLRFAFGKQNKKIKEYSLNLEEKVKEKTKGLQEKVKELEKFQELTVGRELKMAELKKEIKELKKNV